MTLGLFVVVFATAELLREDYIIMQQVKLNVRSECDSTHHATLTHCSTITRLPTYG